LVGKSFWVVPMPLVRWVMPSKRLELTDTGRGALRELLREL
jgi:hypothetical protein